MVEFVRLRAFHNIGEGNKPYHYFDEKSIYCEFRDPSIGKFTLLYSDSGGPVNNSAKHITKSFEFAKLPSAKQKEIAAVCEMILRKI